jgi:hypothetical protein
MEVSEPLHPSPHTNTPNHLALVHLTQWSCCAFGVAAVLKEVLAFAKELNVRSYVGQPQPQCDLPPNQKTPLLLLLLLLRLLPCFLCRLWRMAWPLCWMEVLAFAKELIITSYVGHLGAAELSALVLAQTVYNVTGNAP